MLHFRLFIIFTTTNLLQELADENDSKHFYASSESEKEDEDEDDSTPKKKPYLMDVDHRLLLRTCKPLLNSRNAAVSQRFC